MKMTRERLNQLIGMTEEELDRSADSYENDEVDFSDREVLTGSPLDYLGTRRETFERPEF